MNFTKHLIHNFPNSVIEGPIIADCFGVKGGHSRVIAKQCIPKPGNIFHQDDISVADHYLPAENHLVVIDVLPELPHSGDHHRDFIRLNCHQEAGGAAVSDDNPGIPDQRLHSGEGKHFLPLAMLWDIGAEAGLNDDLLRQRAVRLQVIHGFYQSVEGLLMGAHRNKDHGFVLCSKNTPQVDRLGVYRFHFLPLDDEPVCYRVHQPSGQGGLVYAVIDFDIQGFDTQYFSDVEKRDRYGRAGRNDQVRLFLPQYPPGKLRVDDECLNAPVCGEITGDHPLSRQKAFGILLVEGHPETLLVLPKGLEHMQMGQVAARGTG